jgi:citrate lyase beta subunit
MLPKVEGPWDIHYLDQLLAQLEARHGVTRPVMIHAILETAEGVNNVEAVAHVDNVIQTSCIIGEAFKELANCKFL